MTDFPDLKIKTLVSFPAAVYGGTGLAVRQENGKFYFDLAFGELAQISTVPAPALPTTFLALWESSQDTYRRMNVVDFAAGFGGGVPEAPNDGTQYGRQSLGWTPVVASPSPATATPLVESGAGAVGVSLKYAREDHVHPVFGGGGGASVTVSDTPPGSPTANSLWWESDTGVLFIYYNDGTSSQWVAISGGGGGSGGGVSCGRLFFVSATAIKFAPFDGDGIKIAGTVLQIPSAGIAGVANTGVFVNGVAAQNLAANTSYFVYAFNNSGTVTADFSTTAHATSATAGNVGVEIKSGDNTRTLIGQIRTNASAQFADGSTQRFVRSWFNDPGILGLNAITANGLAVTGGAELGAAIRTEFLTWLGEIVTEELIGTCYGTATGAAISLYPSFNGVSLAAGASRFDTTSGNLSASVPMLAVNNKNDLAEGYNYASANYSLTGTGTANFTISLQLVAKR